MIGDNVKRLRKEKGFSQEKLAWKSGLSLLTVNKIETNKTLNPGVLILEKISQTLGVSIEELLKK